MDLFRARVIVLIAVLAVILEASRSSAAQIPVHHIEGVTFGFLILRNLDGEAVAYGELQQIIKRNAEAKDNEEGELVVGDLVFHFKDGSFYEEITKFTQQGKFRLVSEQVEQRGPSFKQASKSWLASPLTASTPTRSAGPGRPCTLACGRWSLTLTPARSWR